ncbi:hypothetical protein DOTSEDRAFT_82318 [Dothistroma septosporum NZE10]|uniref:Uncharacterized protein n=1 Tax=Dothistroma septosporum (strain NZE10 / CBS 128990) TaxID=675120 RepID=N1PDT8_DOTSN|nr:hypothetical protein DOTSEDRAFT_82318 [Dothistroma septosporum NZE10]
MSTIRFHIPCDAFALVPASIRSKMMSQASEQFFSAGNSSIRMNEAMIALVRAFTTTYLLTSCMNTGLVHVLQDKDQAACLKRPLFACSIVSLLFTSAQREDCTTSSLNSNGYHFQLRQSRRARAPSGDCWDVAAALAEKSRREVATGPMNDYGETNVRCQDDAKHAAAEKARHVMKEKSKTFLDFINSLTDPAGEQTAENGSESIDLTSPTWSFDALDDSTLLSQDVERRSSHASTKYSDASGR